MLRFVFISFFSLFLITNPLASADLDKKHKRLSTVFNISKHPGARVIGVEIVAQSEKFNIAKDKSVQIDFSRKTKKKDLGSFYLTNTNYGGKTILNTNLQTAPSKFDRHEFLLPNDTDTLHATIRFVDGPMKIRHILLIINDPNIAKRPIRKIRGKGLK